MGSVYGRISSTSIVGPTHFFTFITRRNFLIPMNRHMSPPTRFVHALHCLAPTMVFPTHRVVWTTATEETWDGPEASNEAEAELDILVADSRPVCWDFRGSPRFGLVLSGFGGRVASG